MRRKIILIFLIITFISLSVGVSQSGWLKKMFGQGYWMGRFFLGENGFEVTLGDYETRIFILIDTELKKEKYIYNIKKRKRVKTYRSVDYKFSLTTWKDFVNNVNKIDERIDEKLKEIRPENTK